MEAPPHVRGLAVAGVVFAIGLLAVTIEARAAAQQQRSSVQPASRAVYRTMVLLILCSLLWGGSSVGFWIMEQQSDEAGWLGKLLGLLA